MSTASTKTLVDELATVVAPGGWSIVAAESVTAGLIAQSLAQGESASDWFVGSFVTYQTEMKRQILGVRSPGVVSAQCAREMAVGARELTTADVAVAVTGVGGPEPEEGCPPGTVFIGVARGERVDVYDHTFSGDPSAVVQAATDAAITHLIDAVSEWALS